METSKNELLDFWRNKQFTDYTATLYDQLKEVKILDFTHPDSAKEQIRFIFNGKFDLVDIHGDEHIVAKCKDLTYENFGRMFPASAVEKFFQHIKCHTDTIYNYNLTLAKKQLFDYAKDCPMFKNESFNKVTYMIDKILHYFDPFQGLQEYGQDLCWKYGFYIKNIQLLGREDMNLNLVTKYLIAFEVAQEKLKEQSKQNLSDKFMKDDIELSQNNIEAEENER